MEEIKHTGRTFLASRGFWAFWGVATSLLIILFNRYTYHYFESPLRMLARVVIFAAIGVLLGPMSSNLAWVNSKLTTKAATRVLFALFAGLMLAMACVLWFMAKSR